MPGELLSDDRKEGAHVEPAHALLDRLAAAGAGGDLPVGMKSDQTAAAKHPLRLLDRARDQFLHQHLACEHAVYAKVLRVEIVQGAFQISFAAHKPDAAAGGT